MDTTERMELTSLQRLLNEIYNHYFMDPTIAVPSEWLIGLAAHLLAAGFVWVEDVTDDDLDANPEQPHKFVAGEECRVCNRWSNNRLHIGSPMHRALTEVSP